ncbi:hypothetical protein FB567DRAFT_552945 [Paraphoma chrysanthemicola]|uniref:Uncharacterized protein n=1 Tax=Paraphoma chrysanthemicola TaxID=798071 RepID=A0A8K0QXV9_9PLEO|nr:hypothetical protein FB567DRAFT_552945 [Paraphoma chrysanthemicola]
MACFFFTLPLEIREEIYGHLWASHAYVRFESRGDANVSLRSGSLFDAPARVSPLWISACKAIREEALDHFQRTRIISLRIKNTSWPAVNVLEHHVFTPLSAMQIRKLSLDLLVPARRVRSAPLVPPNTRQVTSLEYAARLLSEMADHGRLHTLGMVIHVEAKLALYDNAVDAGAFRAAVKLLVPKLRHLGVNIMVGRSWPTVLKPSSVATVERLVREEVRKVEAGGMCGLVEQHGTDIVRARVMGDDEHSSGVMGWGFLWE